MKLYGSASPVRQLSAGLAFQTRTACLRNQAGAACFLVGSVRNRRKIHRRVIAPSGLIKCPKQAYTFSSFHHGYLILFKQKVRERVMTTDSRQLVASSSGCRYKKQALNAEPAAAAEDEDGQVPLSIGDLLAFVEAPVTGLWSLNGKCRRLSQADTWAWLLAAQPGRCELTADALVLSTSLRLTSPQLPARRALVYSYRC